jgi:hypothetical protein
MPTRAPTTSGSLHIAIVPGGQEGSAPLGIGTASAGGGGDPAAAGAGAGAGVATTAAGVGANAGVATTDLGGGDWVATAGVGAGDEGRCGGVGEEPEVPVMLGAREIGPGSGSTLIGELAPATGGRAESLIGRHPPSHKGIAIAIAADRTTAACHGSQTVFAFCDGGLSSMVGIGPSPACVCRQITASTSGREQCASATPQPTRSSSAITARRNSAGR